MNGNWITTIATFALLAGPIVKVAGQERGNWQIDFSGQGKRGNAQESRTATYTETRGFGFEPGTEVTAEDGFVTAKQPFYFSLDVPEGNYRVQVKLGDRKGASVTTVKAELRRLMVEQCRTKTGEVATRTFAVNVRRPELPGGTKVKFKSREETTEAWAWDRRLTLEFSGESPKLVSLRVEKVNVPTLFIAGDSTSTDQALEPYNSWGQMITAFLTPGLAVANNGESGETADSFRGENRWGKLKSVLKSGDTVMIQFGHNDQKDKRPGAGAFTTFTETLRGFVREVREGGATPVLITPVQRRTFDERGHVMNSLGDFPQAVRQLAAAEHVALIDLHAMSKAFYEAVGPEQAPGLFAPGDGTHHNDYGSYELAKCIAMALGNAKISASLFVVPAARTFRPSRPDPIEGFDVPLDPVKAAAKPYGS